MMSQMVSSSMCFLTVGGMRCWGLRDCEPITRYKPCQRELNLPNHLNSNGV